MTRLLYTLKFLFCVLSLTTQFSLATTISKAPVTTTSVSTEIIELARSKAAQYDMPIISAFLADYNSDDIKYLSYLNENSKTLPQDIINYLYRIITISQYDSLQQDMASTFPFDEFQTFVQPFPWYSNILKSANATTFYVPEDFESTIHIETTSVVSANIGTTNMTSISKNTDNTVVTKTSTISTESNKSSTSNSSESSGTISTKSSNGGSRVIMGFVPAFSSSPLIILTLLSTCLLLPFFLII
ncbi:Afb1p SCDLUD_002636 [Saccharomycodes ludwigii]|uniref:Afb1p n=1 Tax=Saccharomycodes ludwigii TaxID=36035 RepID=UPI001E873C16|nr:hypothetical protein SCDLUD_002636 [Saccharomycodes ludwigii]KAH3901153.1 hypothetical protein SCDLUD_002636 [Saccharomycodes ludwigii]